MIEKIQNIENKKLDFKILFKPGDHIKVHFKIFEDNKEKIQVFEGIVIRIRGSNLSKTFTVRKISFGIGVEKIFPIYSPCISKIDIIKYGKVRRAKLYYLRHLTGKGARIIEDVSRARKSNK
ncbi:MAG: 50S ribosomal protein L19 [Endomicrobium sp.]|nr:50S ribosomal protein L19 [Endomicrobium sp.]